jgi:microcystin-dependent protein
MNKNIVIGLFSILFIFLIYLFVGFRQLSSKDTTSETIVTNNVVEQPYHTHGPVDYGITEDRVVELINANNVITEGGKTIRNVGPKELGFEINGLGSRIDFNIPIKFNNPTTFQETTQFNGQIIGHASEGVTINDDLNVEDINSTGVSSFHTIKDVDIFHPFVGMIVPLHVDFNDTTLMAEIKLKGWVLCDGDNGTPDLRGRFIWGGSQNALGPAFSPDNDANDQPYKTHYQDGGAASSTLVQQEIPRHNHGMWSGEYQQCDGHQGDGPGPAENGDVAQAERRRGGFKRDNCMQHGQEYTRIWGGNSDGSTQPHNNLPPYRVLAYFMYLPSVNLVPTLTYYPGMLKNE